MNRGTMANLGTAYIKIAPDLTGVQGTISRGLNRTMSEAGASAGANFGNSFTKLASDPIVSFGDKVLKGTLIAGSIAAAAMITKNIGSAVRRVDTLNSAPKILQNLGFSASESAKATSKLKDGIKGLPTSLDSAASSLMSIASASGKSVGYATDLTLAFNNMALAGGKGPAEAQRALTQFTQALGRGKFYIQDYNTIAEVMPAQLNQVAKTLLGAGANTKTLGTALSNGKVSIEQFSDAIIELDKKGGDGFASFNQQARDATSGIQTGWDNLNIAITRGVASIIKQIGSDKISAAMSNLGTMFENALTSVGKGLAYISEHKDVFGPLIAGALGFSTAAAVLAGTLKIVELAQQGFNFALNANPIVRVITIVIALASALVYFFTQTETGQKVLANFINKAKELYGWFNKNILPTLKEVGGFISGVFVTSWNELRTAFDSIKESLSGVFSALEPIMPALKTIGIIIGVAIIAPFAMAVAGVLLFTTALVAIVTAVAWVVGKLATFFAWMIERWAYLGNMQKNFMSNIWATTVSIFTGAGDWFKANVVDKIVGAFSGVRERIGGLFTGIWSNIGNSLKTTINAILRLPLRLPEIKAAGKTIIGGQTLIPALAEGGIVSSPTLALIGEGKEPEAVIPLSKLGNINGGQTINQYNTINNNVDMTQALRSLARKVSY